MRKLILLAAVLLFVATPAVAVLCAKCSRKAYTENIGRCGTCAAMTTSGMLKLCPACSRKLGKCEHCRAPIAVGKKPTRKITRPTAAVKVQRIDTNKSGIHTSGKWRYDYSVVLRGERLEQRRGSLYYDGKLVRNAKQFDRMETPWGVMQYFWEAKSDGPNAGWLLRKAGDEPIDLKKGRLVPSPEARERHAASTKVLKENVKTFVLNLRYHGEQRKPFYQLTLSVPQRRADVKAAPFSPFVVIGEKQALKIIDHLLASGFLGRARIWSPYRKAKAVPMPKGPTYVLTVSAGGWVFRDDFGWGPPMLVRLDALRAVLDGDAAVKMDLLLGRLSGLRKTWSGAKESRK